MAKKKGKTEKTLKITLTRSTAGCIQKHRATIEALGLRKIGQTVEHKDNVNTRGMIHSVKHLVHVEE